MWITPQIQEILHRPAPWRGFAFKVVESADGVFILISMEELAKYSMRQQQDLQVWLAGMATDIRKLQVPCYIHEWKRDGNAGSQI